MNPALFLVILAIQAPVRVTTTLSSESVAPGETFELEIRVETNGPVPDIVLGRLPAGVDLLQTASESVMRSDFPSGSTRVVTQSYLLVARVPGTFVLPAASVRSGGREYSGRSVIVTAGPPGQPAGPVLSNPPRLAVSVEPRRAWVGQPILLRAEAMFPRELRSRLTRPATYEPPSASGFWVIDLPDPMTLRLQRVGSETFEVQTHKRFYVPIVPGIHTLAPARLSFEVRTGLLQPPQSGSVLSDPVEVEVLALPETGRPAAFAGAVGKYSMQAAVEPAAVAVGDAATIQVEIRGTGDVRALSAPHIEGTPSTEILPPTEETEQELSGSRIGGRKTFRWAVVPREPGRIALGPIEFAFFDPDARQYQVVRSDSLILDVAGFAGSEELQGLRPADFRPALPGFGFVRTRGFAIAQAIPALLLVLAWVRRRNPRPRAPGSAHRPETSGIPSAVARLRAREGDPAVLHQLAGLLRQVLREPPRGEQPAAPEGPASDRRRLEALLADVDAARFAPGGAPAGAGALIDEAARLLSAQAPGTGRRGGGLPLAVLCAVLALPGVARAGVQDDAFRRGFAALAARDAGAAAAAFEEHVGAHPRDASAWYNLGIAAYRNGDRGGATHAWLQTLALDPRHPGARHNLITVIGPASASLFPSRLSIGGDIALFSLAVVWWAVALSALAIRRLPGRFLAATMVVALFGIGGAWFLGASRSPLATVAADGTRLLGEPAFQSDPSRLLPSGEPLEILLATDGWVRVRSPAGDEGWVERSTLLEVSVR